MILKVDSLSFTAEPPESVICWRSIAGVLSENCSAFKYLRYFTHNSLFSRTISVYSQTVGLCSELRSGS